MTRVILFAYVDSVKHPPPGDGWKGVSSVYFWVPERRVLGPNTEHEIFFFFFKLAGLVYVACDSARNKDKRPPLVRFLSPAI